jgi:hypothetical protein
MGALLGSNLINSEMALASSKPHIIFTHTDLAYDKATVESIIAFEIYPSWVLKSHFGKKGK